MHIRHPSSRVDFLSRVYDDEGVPRSCDRAASGTWPGTRISGTNDEIPNTGPRASVSLHNPLLEHPRSKTKENEARLDDLPFPLDSTSQDE